MDELLKSLANLGAVGVLIWLVIYIFRVLLPDALNRITQELDRQRTEFTRVLGEIMIELRMHREHAQQAASQTANELRELAREISELRRHRDGGSK